MIHYIGIVDGAAGVWGVRVPDCPGVYGVGKTPELAIANAISGLTTWAEATLRDGNTLPKPRLLTEITANSEDAPKAEDGEITVTVPLLLDQVRAPKGP